MVQRSWFARDIFVGAPVYPLVGISSEVCLHDAESSMRPAAGITRKSILVFAAICGLTVASTYYFQPLFPVVGKDLHQSAATISWVSTVLQLGYSLGLFLIVPLGDYFDRRKLVPGLMVVSALGLVGIATSSSVIPLLIWCALVGVTSVVAQIVVGLVATIAEPRQRGAAIGNVMTGLLLGILLARTISGLVAQYLSWRFVFAGAALMVGLLAIGARRSIPAVERSYQGSYPALLRSLGATFASEVVVRRAAIIGALNFACFSIFWNTSSLHLSSHPFKLGSAAIGLFGLVGVAGALAARLAGRMADRGRQWVTSVVMNFLIVLAYVALLIFPFNMVAIVVAVIVLDFGVQGSHISNQATIFAIRPDARSRITSIYMTSYFIGGALGSFLSTLAFRDGGYRLVAAAGVVLALAATTFRLLTLRLPGA